MSKKNIYTWTFLGIILIIILLFVRKIPQRYGIGSLEISTKKIGAKDPTSTRHQSQVNEKTAEERQSFMILKRKSVDKEPNSQSTNHHLKTCRAPIPDPESWTRPIVSSDIQSIPQTDERLAEYLCKEWVLSPFNEMPNLMYPDREHFSRSGQSKIAEQLLDKQRNGFFVEYAPGLGEIDSNSLFFEKTMGWTGLLLQPDPMSFKAVVNTRRHAYMVNSCLSPGDKPVASTLKNVAKTAASHARNDQDGKTVQCFPLKSILQATGVTHVDYLSLNLREVDVRVIETLPFELGFDVINVDCSCAEGVGNSDKLMSSINESLQRFGYSVERRGGTCG